MPNECVDGSSPDRPQFGELEAVNVRDGWRNEASDFTPWLARNLDRLSKELGIGDLEEEGREVKVGPYRADIVARVSGSDEAVVIENQLEQANLQHLGQVIAYMSGLTDAKVAVWIATGFNDALLAAIRWQNEHTVDPYAFFAVRVSVVRIANSPLAPVFEVLERPNRWERQVRERSGESELTQFRRGFWRHFALRRPEAGIPIPYGMGFWRNSVDTPAGPMAVVLFLAAGRVGVFLRGGRGESDEDPWPHLNNAANALYEELNDDRFKDVNDWKFHTEISLDTRNQGNWDKMVDWLDHRRQVYQRVFTAS